MKLFPSQSDSFLWIFLILNLVLISGCREGSESGPPEVNNSEEVSAEIAKSEIDKSSTRDKKTFQKQKITDSKKKRSAQKEKKVYRYSDSVDRAKGVSIKKHGISRYSSKRLILYTDIDPKIAQAFPTYADQLYDSLVSYFGELPPNREGTEFRVTGYLMKDRNSFLKTKLLPEDLTGFSHGRHRGNEFWMNDQKQEYYRRHLLFHEFTHCFMVSLPGIIAPESYLEGMAELFGTHQLDKVDGKEECRFRVFPDRPENFKDFGRIEMIQDDLDKGEYLHLSEVQTIPFEQFSLTTNYAWSWAYCYFLSEHPEFQKAFQQYGQHHVRGVGTETKPLPVLISDQIQLEWSFFIRDLCYGYQLAPTHIQFEQGNELKAGSKLSDIPIQANRGWQSGRVLVRKGVYYKINAEGSFLLSKDPKPWASEASGVSIAYFRDKPLGFLWGTILDEKQGSEEKPSELSLIPVGNQSRFQAKMDGTLYLRINDYPDSLLDNEGSIKVTIQRE